MVTKKFSCPLTGLEKKKKHVCFIGPTSVGKSTLYNKLFNLNLEAGLGSTTKSASLVKETETACYWDAPGVNDDFGFYQPEHLGFFQSMNKVFILFDRDINDVNEIIMVLEKIGVPTRIYVRTKCDLWVSGQKPVDAQLKIDKAEIMKYDKKCK